MSFATQSSSRPVAQPAPTHTIWFASNWRVLVAVIALIASPSLPPTGLSSTYKIKLLTDCKVTYLVASDGHNVGVASEPNHVRRGFLMKTKQPDELCLDPDSFTRVAVRKAGSWWPERISWFDVRSGAPLLFRQLSARVCQAKSLCVLHRNLLK